MNAQEVMSERQVSETYGFTVPYLRRARREKRGPRFLKLGKLVRYRRADVEAFLTAHEVETQPLRGAASLS
jgi:predicted DNA-binding transcriptional regulator AlpA